MRGYHNVETTQDYRGATITRNEYDKTVYIRGKGWQTRFFVRWYGEYKGQRVRSTDRGRTLRNVKRAIDRMIAREERVAERERVEKLANEIVEDAQDRIPGRAEQYAAHSLEVASLAHLGRLVAFCTSEQHELACAELSRRVKGDRAIAIGLFDYHTKAFAKVPCESNQLELIAIMALMRYLASKEA